MARSESEPGWRLSLEEVREGWPLFDRDERQEAFEALPRAEAEELFFRLPARGQADLVLSLPPGERRSWVRLLPPDDLADLVQAAPREEREGLLGLLDDTSREETLALIAYEEDQAGGLMNPRFARVRPEMTVDEAIAYLRRQARDQLETVYYAYALDEAQKLVGVVSFRDLFSASPERRVKDVMCTDLVWVGEDLDQEAVSRVLAHHNLAAVPVLDREGRMKGIVTVHDIVDVVQEEATEDIHKFGGVRALDAPYTHVGLLPMFRRRVGWLSVLFLGELLTATAMAFFEQEVARAVVLAVFLPLIISSGGNSGSQASTLVIRAMALGEVRLRDWWFVVRRELATGLMLGLVLGALGFVRILVWQSVGGVYGEHFVLVGLTVGASLAGVVMFGSVVGSLLPFILRGLGLDPASASAPFVATLVDVTGVIIYFTVARLILTGALL
ncbi:MAG: magnesium transporter [Myxococcaceae bacterium]